MLTHKPRLMACISNKIGYNERMSHTEWNSVTISDEEKPQISPADLREMAADLDPDDFDEPVQNFLEELMHAENTDELRKAATLLLQDEIDFSPELAAMGVEPDLDLIALLLAVGADTNALNPYGLSPLHLAAKYNYTPIAKMLLTAGAKVTTLSHDHQYAVDLATDAELKQLLALPDGLEEAEPLPPELESLMREALSEDDPECDCHGEHPCNCHGGHECSCGHHHHPGE